MNVFDSPPEEPGMVRIESPSVLVTTAGRETNLSEAIFLLVAGFAVGLWMLYAKNPVGEFAFLIVLITIAPWFLLSAQRQGASLLGVARAGMPAEVIVKGSEVSISRGRDQRVLTPATTEAGLVDLFANKFTALVKQTNGEWVAVQCTTADEARWLVRVLDPDAKPLTLTLGVARDEKERTRRALMSAGIGCGLVWAVLHAIYHFQMRSGGQAFVLTLACIVVAGQAPFFAKKLLDPLPLTKLTIGAERLTIVREEETRELPFNLVSGVSQNAAGLVLVFVDATTLLVPTSGMPEAQALVGRILEAIERAGTSVQTGTVSEIGGDLQHAARSLTGDDVTPVSTTKPVAPKRALHEVTGTVQLNRPPAPPPIDDAPKDHGADRVIIAVEPPASFDEQTKRVSFDDVTRKGPAAPEPPTKLVRAPYVKPPVAEPDDDGVTRPALTIPTSRPPSDPDDDDSPGWEEGNDAATRQLTRPPR